MNRIARPFYGEALRIVEENLATIEQVDDAMRTLGNFKMGPFELMDLIGIDVNFSVTKTVYQDYFSNYWVYGIAAFVGLLIINFFWNKSDLKKTKP